MRKVCVKLVPKVLSDEETERRKEFCFGTFWNALKMNQIC